jgi:formate hydrogenlyase subunit 6/NADH:ubiquinone oxidoreductase subunit I
MNIDIASKAYKGIPVVDSLCVGCGHCVDICPKHTLRYTTDVLERIQLKKS